ncbi:MAG: hypothetical protein EA408_03595 [Marinilabiliales bacterium]|nr:MAG: hypothetical protein EA408_03595 [Marinilabiliales bacterium]
MVDGNSRPRPERRGDGYYAVFGNPVLHSRSPQLYNSMFALHGIDAFYTRILTSSAGRVCALIRGMGLAGGNVTTPFKDGVVSCVDSLSPDARLIGAVNTIVSRNGLLTGYNTDGTGVTGALLEAGHDPAGKRCMVIGAGGAGRAAAVGLVRAGADVVMVNRNIERFAGFASRLGCRIAEPGAADTGTADTGVADTGAADPGAKSVRSGSSDVDPGAKSVRSGSSDIHPGDYDIIVVTLPPGVFPFDRRQLHERQVILDANYRPADVSGPAGWPCRVVTGERWLLHQATEAYRLFTGRAADTSVMDEAMAHVPAPDDIVTAVVIDEHRSAMEYGRPGLLVDAAGYDAGELKRITDEEKNRAFGH